MIRVLHCEQDDVKREIVGKRIFCFGSGRFFVKFIEHHPQCPICGVIDNYRREDMVSVGSNNYKILSMQDFRKIYSSDCVLIITVRFYEEVIDQLNAIEELNGILCLFPFVVEDYFNIADDRRQFMKNQIEKMSIGIPIEEKTKATGRYYQISEYFEKTNIGGDKARADISYILTQQGYQMKKIHCASNLDIDLRKQQMIQDWKNLFERIENHAVVFMQHPIPIEIELPEPLWRQMKEEKHVRFIIMVHEVEELRITFTNPYRKHEFEVMLSIGDAFIVHNEVMQRYFFNLGIKEERVVSLGSFDYLSMQNNTKKKFEKSVTIAANLNLTKSPYLLQLKQLESLNIHLYGPNYHEDITRGSKNIVYHGSLLPEVIPSKLDRGFGLIWDGNSIETCSGGTGEYLKYNNPHKLSLYLSAGLPVVIWSQAAQAQFVLENKVGFCVDSLYEISDKLEEMTEEQYRSYVSHAEALSQKLKNGDYFKSALQKAEEVLCRIYGSV